MLLKVLVIVVQSITEEYFFADTIEYSIAQAANLDRLAQPSLFVIAADILFVNNILIGIGLIFVGVLHIVAAHKEWGWYVNHYQVKPILKSKGHTGLRLYTYLMCSPCIGFGVYMLANGGGMSN